MAAEYRVRHRWGDQPQHEGFVNRIPENAEAVKNLLVRVDEDLELESFGSTVQLNWYRDFHQEIERALQAGERPQVESFLLRRNNVDRQMALVALIELEAGNRPRGSELPRIDDYIQRFPIFFSTRCRAGLRTDRAGNSAHSLPARARARR